MWCNKLSQCYCKAMTSSQCCNVVIMLLLRSSLARGPLSEILKDELCEVVNKAINRNINEELAHLSMQVPLNSNLYLDYQLTSAPRIQPNWVEFSHSGTVFGGSVPKESLPDDQVRISYSWRLVFPRLNRFTEIFKQLKLKLLKTNYLKLVH